MVLGKVVQVMMTRQVDLPASLDDSMDRLLRRLSIISIPTPYCMVIDNRVYHTISHPMTTSVSDTIVSALSILEGVPL